MKKIQQIIGKGVGKVHICTYAAPFGVVPMELNEVYPLSQHEIATPFDGETITYVANQVEDYIKKTGYEKIILLQDTKIWNGKIVEATKRICKKKKTPLTVIQGIETWDETTLDNLVTAIRDAIER